MRNGRAASLPREEESVLFSQIATGLLVARSPEEVRRTVSGTVHRLSGALATIVSLYDPQARSIRLAHAHGLEGLVSFVERLGLGRLVETRVPLSSMSEEEMRAFTSGRLYRLPGGLHALSARTIPLTLCALVEKSFGIKAIWTMGFSWQGSLYGGASMVCRSEGPLEHSVLLETIINLAAVALQRAYAEEEQSRLRDQLLQARKMEAVGRLAGGIAHDFNNVLTVITGSSDALAEALPPGSPLDADVAEIREAARKATDLTRQLLSFSRREIEQPSVADLDSTIHGMSGMLRRIVGEDIELALDLGSGPACVRIDPSQLSQVILNLAANARDAMPRGGRLHIRTECSAVDDESARCIGVPRAGRYLSMAMSDTGIGMDSQTLSRLFEPFFTTKEPGQGTGLGLSIAYGVAEKAGGTVRADSRLAEGTTITVWLPAVECPPVPAAAPAPPDPPPQAQGEILLVEDDEAVRRYLVKLLERKGYTVHAAGTGAQALAVLQGLRRVPRVLITDLVMPGISGRTLADHVRRIVPSIEVLFVSGYTDDTVVRHGIVEGSIDFLRKPFSRDDLYAHVARLMARGGRSENPSP
jgi:signal transduction histidine kinase/ActR/RegA family two-component response regulator